MPANNSQMVQQRIIYGGGGVGTGRTKRKGEREWRALREGAISASTVHGMLSNYRGIRIQYDSQSPFTAHKLDGKPSEIKKKQPDSKVVH